MHIINIISGPIIGGIIGYFTNYIAIKMLFRPLNPVKIGKYTLPFTPGIVPKRKDKLGGVLGSAVVSKFFTYDDLEDIFLSDYFKNAVTESIVNLLYHENTKSSDDNEKLEQSEAHEEFKTKIKEGLCIRILAGLLKSDISSIIAKAGPDILKKSMSSSTVSKLITDDIVEKIAEPLGKSIEKYILTEGRYLLMPILDEEFSELSQNSLASIMNDLEIEIEVTRSVLNDFYISFMRTRTRGIVEHIDVSGIIESKIKNMNASEIEDLTLSVVNRELHYIVLLGALIGFIIGTTNIFI